MTLIQGTSMAVRLVKNKFIINMDAVRNWLDLKQLIEIWLNDAAVGQYYVDFKYGERLHVFLENHTDAMHFKLHFEGLELEF